MGKRSSKAGHRLASASTLVSSFLETADAVEARLEAAVSPMGLSLAKLGLLHHLAEAKEPLPLSELAQHQNCVRSNITQLVDRLEKEGLVRRRPDPEDRRASRLTSEASGRSPKRSGPSSRRSRAGRPRA
jgi:DNA-binding MarR family transcriptional regulator